jgi:hypothetical protein
VLINAARLLIEFDGRAATLLDGRSLFIIKLGVLISPCRLVPICITRGLPPISFDISHAE